MSSMEDLVAAAAAEAVREDLDRIATELAELRRAVQGGPAAERLLSRAQIAEWAGCSTRVVDMWTAEGAPHVRLGGPGGSPRFRVSELHEWLRARTAA